MTLIAAGCSSNGGGADEGPVTLTFAAVTFTETGRGEALEAWLDGFNTSQDAVRVEPAGIPFATFSQTVLTQIGGGEGPDLIRFDQADFVQAASAGLLEPLEDHIDFGQYDLIEGPDAYAFVDDTRYGVMFDVASYSLIYNTDLVETPPTTFEDFLAMSEELTGDGTYGMAFRQTKEQEPGMMQDLYNYVYGFGGAFSDGTELTLNSPEVVEGLTAYQTLYDAEVIPRGADAATYRRMFAEGLVAMTIDNGGVPGILLGANPDLNIAAAPNPFPVESQGGIIVPITINAGSEHKEAAASFIEWMLEPENQVSLQEVMGAGSVATHTERSAEQLAAAPYLQVFDDLTDSTQPQIIEGFEAQTPELRIIIVDQVLSALHGEKTMQAAMDEAQEMAVARFGG
ncbi:sugar ABC transporter substrate-binding protein [Actinotalea sp. K2]|uniref:ABC transporter substrate-binding protein n=1 Tax=Actinotalea sp. K2 TaxID=2939438 RepID=UPI002016AE5F|nr:sugar ABC transporter substrate-binding protein [Actinotalea sp. K2]MCL3861610.1 sugar ABC transporter substrate-binding protein [Actinotalea sp. K2]